MMRREQSIDTRIRRHQISLIIAGRGVIIFGLWTLIRAILTVTLTGDKFIQEFVANGGNMEGITNRLVYAVYIVIAVVIVLLRLFVGLSAISEGKGKKTRYVYLVVAILMVISALIDYYTRVTHLQWPNDFALSEIVQRIVDITSVITTIHLIVSGIALKRLTKEKE